jgi:serine protease AprX
MVATRGRHLRTLAFLFIAVLALPALAPAQGRTAGYAPSKLDRLLTARARQLTGRSRVIVEFNGTPDVRAILSANGVATRTLRGSPAQVAEIRNADLASLARDPRVKRVMADRPTFATLERTGKAVGSPFTAGITNPPETPETGNGVTIAVIDSGVNAEHDDLRRSGGQRVLHFGDFTTSTPGVWTNAPPHDGFGHGTHVAGILAGNGYLSNGKRRSISRNAKLVALKVLDDDGRGFVSDVIEAIDYAIAIKTTFGIRVINLSVGAGVYESYDTDPLTLAAKRAVDAGIVVVASAGNLGQNAELEAQYGGITSPANAPWVLSVGASSHQGTIARGDDTMAAFTSRGPTWLDFSAKPDLVAPGVGIESLTDPESALFALLPHQLLDGTRPYPYKPYISLTGTSMAAPVVSAAVALLLEASPSLTPNAVKAILQYTAEVRPNVSPLAQGAGLVNVKGALRLARFFANPESNPLGQPVDTISGQSISWAKHLIWGNYRVTGGVPLPGSNAWATNVVWGEMHTPGGSLVVWGAADPDNVVWGETTGGNVVWGELTGDNVVWGESGTDNVVWGESGGDNVVWGEAHSDNVVWGEDCSGSNCETVVWGEPNGTGAWGTAQPTDNVVWGEGIPDNVVWGEAINVVWGEHLRNHQVVWPATETKEP